MKVQSWTTLLVTIFIGGGGLVYKFISALAGDIFDYYWVILFAWFITKGLCISLIEEEWEKEQKRSRAVKKVYRKRFGKLAPMAPYGHFILIGLAIFGLHLFPEGTVSMVFSSLGLIYVVWLALTIPKRIRAEIEAENKAENEHKA